MIFRAESLVSNTLYKPTTLILTFFSFDMLLCIQECKVKARMMEHWTHSLLNVTAEAAYLSSRSFMSFWTSLNERRGVVLPWGVRGWRPACCFGANRPVFAIDQSPFILCRLMGFSHSTFHPSPAPVQLFFSTNPSLDSSPRYPSQLGLLLIVDIENMW